MGVEQHGADMNRPDATMGENLGDQPAYTFMTASSCVGDGNCVEVSWCPDPKDPNGIRVVMRNSINTEAELHFSSADWRDFIGNIMKGMFE